MVRQVIDNPYITVDGNSAKPLRPFFAATGYANADFTYTPPFRRMYDYLSSFSGHLYYMRLHNILTLHGDGDKYFLKWDMDYGNQRFDFDNRHNGNDKVVSLSKNGSLEYGWELVDRVYDIIAEHDMVPIVELCYMPLAVRKSAEEFIQPASYKLYAQVIRDFVLHCRERYGEENVRRWYFEIWNEPDNHKLWCEKPDYFYALYDYMEDAVHKVDPELKVGGPATKQFEEAYGIFEGFIRHCSEGVNYVSGGYGTRLDFISVHCKGGWPEATCPSSDVMFDAVQRYLDILENFPQYRGTEFFNDESDIVWHGNKGVWEASWLSFRNTHYAPAFVCKMVSRYCTEIEDGRNVNLAVVDSDNAHLQWERYLFSGNRSQFTPLGEYPCCDLIKKPFFNAYPLLARLGNERFTASCEDNDGFGHKYGVIPTRRDGSLAVMAWNFEDGMDEGGNTRTLHIKLENIGLSGTYNLAHFRIDAAHSNSYAAWQAMGSPKKPDAAQIKKLRTTEGLELLGPVVPVEISGAFSLDVELPMHAVSLLVVTPKTAAAPASAKILKAEPETGSAGRQVFLKWTPNAESDFLYYKVLRREGSGDYVTLSDSTALGTAVFVDMDAKAGGVYAYKIVSVNMSGIESVSGASEEVRP